MHPFKVHACNRTRCRHATFVRLLHRSRHREAEFYANGAQRILFGSRGIIDRVRARLARIRNVLGMRHVPGILGAFRLARMAFDCSLYGVALVHAERAPLRRDDALRRVDAAMARYDIAHERNDDISDSLSLRLRA